METREFKPYLVLIILLAAASIAYALTVSYEISSVAGIEVRLPHRIGEWQGNELRYCQNPDHRQEYTAENLEDPDTCPECGFEMSGMSYWERQILPDDTVILKKRYQHPSQEVVLASIVLSGAERSSIHRPEVCLQGQNQRITGSRVISIPLEGRDDLDVMVLTLRRTVPGPNNTTHEFLTYYAYWFVGKGRETPHHIQRMIWMGFDSIFNRVAHRWAYIAVSGARVDHEDETYLDQIRQFVSEFYPEMVMN